MRNPGILMVAILFTGPLPELGAQSKKPGDAFLIPSVHVAETPMVELLSDSPLVKKLSEDGRYSPEDINLFVDMGAPVSVLHTSSMGRDARCCWTVKSFVIVREGNGLRAYPIVNGGDPDGVFPQIRITAMYGEPGHVGVVGMIGRSADGVTRKYKFLLPVRPGHYIVQEVK